MRPGAAQYSDFMSQSISPSQARQKLEEGAGYIDVRTPGEFAAGHVPGAVNIPLDQLQQRYDDLPTEGDLIVGCASGSRSARAVELLSGNVKCELHQLEGGYQAWEAQGLPIQAAEGAPWSLDRQVLFAAGSVALLGLAIGKVVPPVRKLSWLASGGLMYAGASGNCYLRKLLMKAPWNQEPEIWAVRADEWKQRGVERAQGLMHQAGDKAKEVGHQAAEKAREAAHNVKERFKSEDGEEVRFPE